MPNDSVFTASEKAAARLRMALDLFETGVEMMRQKLRRDHPDLADHEVEARLGSWLRELEPVRRGQPRRSGGSISVIAGPRNHL